MTTTNPQPDHAYALLESHFDAPPLHRQRSYSPRPAPLRHDTHDTTTTTATTDSVFSSQQPTPLDPPAAVNGPDSGLPPTPPTMSQDGQSTDSPDAAPHDESLLMSKKSSLSTPVNARSPPTPDPSPPRTASTGTTTHSNSALERPPLVAYPSSRAESFKTAREDASSEPSRSRSVTPIDNRLSTVEEDRGLGLAFEVSENDITPTDTSRPFYPPADEADTMAGAQEDKEPPVEDIIPDREWNTDLMRNVTVRRKRKPKSSPEEEPTPAVEPTDAASPSPSPRPRRTSGLRERVEASTNSPVTPSIEKFAQSIGWPSENKAVPEVVAEPEESNKRNSTSSMGSTRVEASIIVTPPRRRQTLRHSGKNMAYRDTSPTPDRPLRRRSNRDSSQTEDVPLHRLVHKKVNLADRSKRISTDSATLGYSYERPMSTAPGYERSMSSPLSFRSRIIDSSAATLAHQQSLRNVLQPAADILSRSSSVTKYHYSERVYHRRNGSAPENGRKSALSTVSAAPRSISQQSPPTSSRRNGNVSFQTPPVDISPVQSPVPSMSSPRSLKRRQRSSVAHVKLAADVHNSLPVAPVEEDESATRDVFLGASAPVQDRQPSAALLDRVRQLVATQAKPVDERTEPKQVVPASPEQIAAPSPPEEYSPPVRRGSRSIRGRSGERRRSTPSQDRASTSPEILIRPSLDRISTEEMVRRSHEWRRPSLEHGRVSFDRSTFRSEEHAGARHQFASTTPFSQFSDTPIEVSEATAVSIFPHNNHSLLVVQQGSRVNSMTPEPRQLLNGTHLSLHDYHDVRSTPTPPFVDAIDYDSGHDQPKQPTLTFEPSTPPMQFDQQQANTVDSPLKNPRPPPEPPQIMFIPPTPAEELEKQLVPGPPERSDSHPQRRLSLAQRARRYSDNLIPTLLSRKGSTRKRDSTEPHKTHRNPQVPSVSDEDGQLHPFWRPRGFWDGFDDDTDSESEDEGLHPGGDTSDVETLPDPPPKRTGTLRRRLTSSVRGSRGFLIGNSLGVERHGTNRRRHHITLPPNFPRLPRTSSHNASPKILIQAPTQPLGAHGGGGITKRPSRSSLRRSFDTPPRRQSWRQGKSLPGLKKYQVQYIGISGVKDKLRERSQEKRRQKIRQSIGSRIYMEPGSPNTNAA